FYGLLRVIARRQPVGVRLVAATLLEASWEVLENSSFIINRYRAATISLDYYGDSVINSVSDILAMIVGLGLARRAPVWAVLTAAIVMEVAVGYWIRDNLTLNIIMLVYPVAAIRRWQSGA